MHLIRLDRPDDFETWREGARRALAHGLPPEVVRTIVAGEAGGLFDAEGTAPPTAAGGLAPKVPTGFVETARQAACHTDPERYALLYRLLWRMAREPHLLANRGDRDVDRVERLAKAVRRDAHKMKAFVRFRLVEGSGPERYVAWFEPDHHIVRFTAPFFARRFASMEWSILTPAECAHWRGGEGEDDLVFTPGVPRSAAPEEDALEDYWRQYYAAIFNPARLKLDAMRAEMPVKYWHNLPEAALIPDLVAHAREREDAMRNAEGTAPNASTMRHQASLFEDDAAEEGAVPSERPASLPALRTLVDACRACPLYKDATQAVPGKGPADARLMLVGEQPGDQEDLRGEPFVGPAGQLLRELMGEVGLDPAEAYVTNAVKHFKFEARGRRRIHQNPTAGEIDICKGWLMDEVALVQPQIVMALGGSAVRGLTGRTQTVKSMRGLVHELERPASRGDGAPMRNTPLQMVVANHPSFLLRVPNEGAKRAARAGLLADLKTVRELLAA